MTYTIQIVKKHFQVERADTFWTRFKGLLGKKSLADHEALLLSPCTQVHSFFMRIPLDVLYLDEGMTVLDKEQLVPWRSGKRVKGTKQVLEAGLGSFVDVEIGERLEIPSVEKKKVLKRESGQSLVEFAILLPVLILLLLIPVDLYRFANQKNILKSAAAESLGQITYGDTSLGITVTAGVIQDTVSLYYGDKLDVGLVEVRDLGISASKTEHYDYYVYNSDLGINNPEDFQAQFDLHPGEYRVVEVSVKLIYPFEPMTFWGSLFLGEGAKVETPIYKRNVYMVVE